MDITPTPTIPTQYRPRWRNLPKLAYGSAHATAWPRFLASRPLAWNLWVSTWLLGCVLTLAHGKGRLAAHYDEDKHVWTLLEARPVQDPKDGSRWRSYLILTAAVLAIFLAAISLEIALILLGLPPEWLAIPFVLSLLPLGRSLFLVLPHATRLGWYRWRLRLRGIRTLRVNGAASYPRGQDAGKHYLRDL